MYTSLLLIIRLCLTSDEREICPAIKKCQNIMTMIVDEDVYASERHWDLLKLNYRRFRYEKYSLFSKKEQLLEFVW